MMIMSKLYFGIDISSIQGQIDFKKEKENGIDFVIAKCYEGNKGLDKNYKNYVRDAQEAGLAVGSYHFVYPLPNDGINKNRSPKEQAELHFKECLTEMVACDIEWPAVGGEWKKWNCNANQINDWTMNYLIEYEKLSGIKPYVYTYPSFADTVKFSKEIAQYPLWIASYQKTPYIPKPWSDWVIWQNSGGKERKLLNGIPVDTNYCKDLSIFSNDGPTTKDSITLDTMIPIIISPLPEKEDEIPVDIVIEQPKSFWQMVLEFIMKLFK